MPDSNFDFATASTVELQLFIATLHNKIIVMVGCACRKYKRFASPDKISDITQEVTCLLLKNDCHALRTYYAERSKFPTWLNTVVEHEVTRDSQKAHPVEPLEDILSSMLRCAPTQEQELLQKERLALLYEEIKKLRPHNQSIA